MHTEDLLIDDRSDRQAIEAICEGLPQFYVVPTFTYVISVHQKVGTYELQTLNIHSS